MNFRISTNQKYKRVAIAVGTFAAALVAFSSSRVVAASSDSFNVEISEKSGALLPDAASKMSYMSRDLGHDRMLYRNRPYFELTNNSTSTDPLTQFHVALGDTRFNFNCGALAGGCAMLAKSTPGFALTSATSSGGDQLDLTIGNGGLLPGQTIRFQIALGFDTQYASDSDYIAIPDYRSVLFKGDGIEYYPDHAPASDPSDPTANNAKVTALFSSASGPLAAGPVTLKNYDLDSNAAKYVNKAHAYGMTDPVQVFNLVGSAVGVPEPSTVALAAIGTLFGLVPAVRRYRRGN